MSDNATHSAQPASKTAYLRAYWLNYRRKRFWAIVAVVLYTVCGFFLVPALISHFSVKAIEDTTGRTASIAETRFNPYVLSLQINGFELRDTDNEILLSFEEFFVNFQLSSLFRWAWTFREVRLDGPHFLYERFTAEDDRLSRLLADVERLNPESEDQSTEDEPGKLPRLLVGDLAFNKGSLLFRDHSPGETVEIPAGPVTAAVQNLNTLPDLDGQQRVQVELARGATLTWQGNLSLEPLRSTGSLKLDGSELDPLDPYFKSILPLDSIRAKLFTQTDYALEQVGEEPLSLVLSNLEARLENVALRGLVPSSEFFLFESLSVSGGRLQYPENTLHVEKVLLDRPFVDVWLGEDGQPGLLQMVPPDNAEPESGIDDAAAPWALSIDEFGITGGSMALSDRSVTPEAGVGVEKLQLTVNGIDNRDGTMMPVSAALELAGGGVVRLDGEAGFLPAVTLSGAVTAEGIPLTLAQPYVQQHLAVGIDGGTLSTGTELDFDAEGTLSAVGQLSVDDLAVEDTRENESLLAWERLEVDRFEVEAAAASARVSSMRFTRPYGRLRILEDLSTNVGNVLIESAPANETPPESPAWSAVVGGIAFDDGALDFADLSLFLPFSTRITGLDGTVSTIDNQSAEPSNIRLEGQVDEFGLSRIEGSMNLLDPIALTDVTVEFRNLLMSNLSPYSAEFAGREIDEGKLDLDLRYVIRDGQLDGQNEVVLSDLVLGDEVDNPDAVSLPLGLAVALLTDSEGVIDIELPVEGDINDPEFRIGGVVWKAIAGLITKVVSAPFKMLGSLIGIESEDLGQFEFLAGRSDLTPPELEKIGQIGQALAQRPELVLEIAGTYDPKIDRPALQYASLRATVFERLGRDPTQEGDRSEMLDEEILGALEKLFVERFPETPLDGIKAQFSAPPANDPEGKPVLDRTAYSGELRDRLIASESVGQADLEELAMRRARAVMESFVADGGLESSRARLSDPTEVESDDGEWVVLELGVAAD